MKKIIISAVFIVLGLFARPGISGAATSINEAFQYYAKLVGQAQSCGINYSRAIGVIDAWLENYYKTTGADKKSWQASFDMTAKIAKKEMDKNKSAYECSVVQTRIAAFDKDLGKVNLIPKNPQQPTPTTLVPTQKAQQPAGQVPQDSKTAVPVKKSGQSPMF